MEQDPQNRQKPEQESYDPHWAKNFVTELKDSLSEIGNSIEKAWHEGTNQLKVKQVGKKVETALKDLGKDIDDLFK